MSSVTGQSKSPVEDHAWPEKLTARVVTPGSRPRVHGYDVETDLAPHYGFGESVLLALTGVAPDDATGAAFEVAMTFLSPLAVTEAPTHAAVLAHTCAGSTAAVTGTTALALAEHARWIMARNAAFIAWLDAGGSGELPEIARAVDNDDRQSADRLRQTLGERAAGWLPAGDLGRDAALLALLHACGLRKPEQMEVAIVVSRLATSVAEALAGKRGALHEYPMNLPPFLYVEDQR
jgi:hypothetical protein